MTMACIPELGRFAESLRGVHRVSLDYSLDEATRLLKWHRAAIIRGINREEPPAPYTQGEYERIIAETRAVIHHWQQVIRIIKAEIVRRALES